MHGLFSEVLALLSGQENSGSFRQSADQRHLQAAVPQLQGLHPAERKVCGAQRPSPIRLGYK